MSAHLADWLPAHSLDNWQQATLKLTQADVSTDLAKGLTALEFIFPALDLVDLATNAGATLEQAARTYFALDNQLGLIAWRAQINRLPTDTLWQTQARGSARDDVYAIASQITQTVLARYSGLRTGQRSMRLRLSDYANCFRRSACRGRSGTHFGCAARTTPSRVMVSHASVIAAMLDWIA